MLLTQDTQLEELRNWHARHLLIMNQWSIQRDMSGSSRVVSGKPIYLKIPKMSPQNHVKYQNLEKQYNKRPNVSVKILYTQYKIPLYTIYRYLKTLADPDIYILVLNPFSVDYQWNWSMDYLRLVFSSNGVKVRVVVRSTECCNLVKIKPTGW